jgi:hypothetical protein
MFLHRGMQIGFSMLARIASPLANGEGMDRVTGGACYRMKANAIRFFETGGPEVLKFVEVDVPDPGPGQARVRHTAVGVNLADTYIRKGDHQRGDVAAGIGLEAAGIVDAGGTGVEKV